MKAATAIALDPKQPCAEAVELGQQLKSEVIGQDLAVDQVVSAMLKYMAGLHAPRRPLANLLFLGPTGVGKTKMVEAVAHCLHRDENKFLKLDCSEFQESHSIAKLIGAPAGYVGHNDTTPFITQDKLNVIQSEHTKISLVLFDEIEKAHQAFWDLLLGVLDQGKLTTAKGDTIDFSRCLIVLTSNLGGKEMTDALQGSLGFATVKAGDRQLDSISQRATMRCFRPEFRNRLDGVVTFRTLDHGDLVRILRLEMRRVQERILSSAKHQAFVFSCSPEAENFLVQKGSDTRYGARHLKRAVEQYLVDPLAELILTGQVELGDLVRVGSNGTELSFDKIPGEAVAALPEAEWSDYQHVAD